MPVMPYLGADPSQIPGSTARPRTTRSESRGLPVCSPAFAGTHAPTHGWMAKLSRPWWLVLHVDGLLALRWLPMMLVPTGPSVAHRR